MPAVKTYTRVNFQNYPSTSTPLNATNLNKMDKGIDDLDDEVVTVKNAIENMSFDADSISYDNTSSGLQATDVQDAVDEINDNLSWYIANGFLPSRDIPANMEDCSWATLKMLADNDTLKNYYQIGDTKTIELNGGERVVMELVSINDGSGTAGAYYPRGTVDFISKDSMLTQRRVNATTTSAGGWSSSELRSVLNSTIYDTLPQEVKNTIVQKTHKTSAGNGSTTLIEHSDKLWLPTEWEMFGSTIRAVSTENGSVNNHYSLFENDASRIKHLGSDGVIEYWWLCSPFANSGSANFCIIDTTGADVGGGAASPHGVPICFRIGHNYT